MNILIVNRVAGSGDEDWYNIEANGEHVNHAWGVVQVIDAKAISSIVKRFQDEAASAGDNHDGMRIDKDHLSDSMENPTEAMGWLMALRDSGGKLEGRIVWTPLGMPLVRPSAGMAPAYKFFSTGYYPGECEELGERDIKGKTYSVMRPLSPGDN